MQYDSRSVLRKTEHSDEKVNKEFKTFVKNYQKAWKGPKPDLYASEQTNSMYITRLITAVTVLCAFTPLQSTKILGFQWNAYILDQHFKNM